MAYRRMFRLVRHSTRGRGASWRPTTLSCVDIAHDCDLCVFWERIKRREADYGDKRRIVPCAVLSVDADGTINSVNRGHGCRDMPWWISDYFTWWSLTKVIPSGEMWRAVGPRLTTCRHHLYLRRNSWVCMESVLRASRVKLECPYHLSHDSAHLTPHSRTHIHCKIS